MLNNKILNLALATTDNEPITKTYSNANWFSEEPLNNRLNFGNRQLHNITAASANN